MGENRLDACRPLPLARVGVVVFLIVAAAPAELTCDLEMAKPDDVAASDTQKSEGSSLPDGQEQAESLDVPCVPDCGGVPALCNCDPLCEVPVMKEGVCTCKPKCNDFDDCTYDFCDPVTGECKYIPCSDVTESQPCLEETVLTCGTGNLCAVSIGCCCELYSKCVIDIPIDCDDGIGFTTDVCGFQTGQCLYLSVEPGFGKTGLSWKDNACISLTAIMDPLVPFGTKVKDCDDGDPTTNDWCDKATNKCIHQEIPAECFDGDPCTWDFQEGDILNEGEGGCLHVPVECDDANACTLDSCDPSSGKCVHTPVSCDDGDACTVDQCDILIGCRHERKIDFWDVRDICAHNWCDPVTGQWHHDPIPEKCADMDLCTEDSVDELGNCIHTPMSCDDGNPCTVDICKVVYEKKGGFESGLCHYELAPECGL